MLKTLKTSYLSTCGAAYYWLAGVPVAYANNGIFGEVPNLGGPNGDARSIIIGITTTILNIMALIAVVVIVIAGIRLVISQGEQEAVEKGKKTILFAILGLIVILLARAIVDFIATNVAGG
ncbi:hypothetical protein KJ652_05135 [Patescibacteria group bacterium]|nr:hypothetical protein [Patescibacteria group bacterium]MBU1123947.1 hypothetical protein [Patescibacteria group bacterium]